ncbi:MAG TPA: zf-HC2 domain-containing protein [Solirubrobacterales bacterium]|nr:zf-HC2 domain-containing protein [Solirubrobacterales bacterium]
MRAEEHREMRHALGAYALGDLPAAERAPLEGHLRECADCRAELAALESVASLLPLADPARFDQPAPLPPAELGERVAAAIGGEHRAHRTRRQRRRFGFALAGATAAVAVALALVVFSGGEGSGEDPTQHVEFGSLPGKVQISASLVPHAFGTEIHMYVKGARSGTLCRVFLRDRQGRSFSAGSFRYRWGDDSNAVLSSALDLSQTQSIAIHVGDRTYLAPVGQGAGPATWNPNEEDA